MSATLALFELPPASLDVRPQRELTQMEQELVARGGLGDLAPIEAWTARGSSHQLSYATHGVFRFFGKFPPPIASHLILNHTAPGELVIDPMCGSGTTGVECILANRQAVLGDVNPFALLLTRVKTRRIETHLLDAALATVATNYRPLTIEESGFTPLDLRNLDHWFLPETADSLRGIRQLVEAEPCERVREALQVALAATVRRVSRATTQQGRLFLDVNTALPDALDTFVHRARRLSAALAELPSRTSEVEVSVVDMLKPELSIQAPLVILHPPYFNSYRYSAINSLELAWLGMGLKDVRRCEVKEFFKVGKEENLSRYLADMSTVLVNASNLIAPGGVLALMIGDTTLKAQHVRVVRPLLDQLPTSLELEGIALRVPRFTEATWVASQRRTSDAVGIKLMDYVLTFRKQRR